MAKKPKHKRTTKREFKAILTELQPIIRTQRRGKMLDVWCEELAVEQAKLWTDEDLIASLEYLGREGFTFFAEARAFYEKVLRQRWAEQVCRVP
jgi:hypothetical protein